MNIVDITVNLETHPWDDLDVAGVELATLTRVGLMPSGGTRQRPAVVALVQTETGPIGVYVSYELCRVIARAFAASPIGRAAEESL